MEKAAFASTPLNRQGPDVGTQYRSAIFSGKPEQMKTAQAAKERQREHSGMAPGRRKADTSGKFPEVIKGRDLFEAEGHL